MKVQPFNPDFKQLWNQFCFAQEDAWFWHTTHWMDYCLACRFDVQSENASFLLIDNDEQTIYAIVPLLKETSTKGLDSISEFTYGGGPTPTPVISKRLGEKKQREVKRIIFNHYHILARHHQVKRIVLRQPNRFMSRRGESAEPIYLRHSFIELPSYTSVLSLCKDEQTLYQEMHDNHKWEIRKAKRLDVKVDSWGSQTITRKIMDAFVLAYEEAAGKKTRPEVTFERLYQLTHEGCGYLFDLKLADKTIAYVYVLVYKKYAYYCMGCNLDSSVIGSHLLQWEIIKFLKANKIDYYEMGEQYFSPTLYQPLDQKNITISRFKRHFGGSLVQMHTAEQFYSREYMFQLWKDRLEKFAPGGECLREDSVQE